MFKVGLYKPVLFRPFTDFRGRQHIVVSYQCCIVVLAVLLCCVLIEHVCF